MGLYDGQGRRWLPESLRGVAEMEGGSNRQPLPRTRCVALGAICGRGPLGWRICSRQQVCRAAGRSGMCNLTQFPFAIDGCCVYCFRACLQAAISLDLRPSYTLTYWTLVPPRLGVHFHVLRDAPKHTSLRTADQTLERGRLHWHGGWEVSSSLSAVR